MREQAAGTVLDSVLRIAETAAAATSECVQRAVAEQAAKGLGIRPRVTGVEFAELVLEKIVMLFLHRGTSFVTGRRTGISQDGTIFSPSPV